MHSNKPSAAILKSPRQELAQAVQHEIQDQLLAAFGMPSDEINSAGFIHRQDEKMREKNPRSLKPEKKALENSDRSGLFSVATDGEDGH